MNHFIKLIVEFFVVLKDYLIVIITLVFKFLKDNLGNKTVIIIALLIASWYAFFYALIHLIKFVYYTILWKNQKMVMT